jgi:hypothetical protein
MISKQAIMGTVAILFMASASPCSALFTMPGCHYVDLDPATGTYPSKPDGCRCGAGGLHDPRLLVQCRAGSCEPGAPLQVPASKFCGLHAPKPARAR